MPFVERCVDEILASVPRIVGFSSSFQQHAASLAVAKRLKERAPQTIVLFGGANCEGDMGRETVAAFEFVDAVVSGEGDAIVPVLVERLLRGSCRGIYPAYTCAAMRANRPANAPAIVDLDALPYPDFSDYFAALPDVAAAETRLNIETSRGCWWGQKHHCTFCGLNGSAMAYRKKSPKRAVDELEALARTYGVRRFAATDNILDAGYFTTALADLARRDLGIELFYETKANLREAQIRALADAGVRSIQPGIESLSTPVLVLMRKGVSALRNVQTLKWCRAAGIAVTWNVLYGFPGESPDDYRAMEALVPLLAHLTPPSYVGRLRLDRYSPMYEAPASVRPHGRRARARLRAPLRLPSASLRRLAYYFTFAMPTAACPNRMRAASSGRSPPGRRRTRARISSRSTTARMRSSAIIGPSR